MHYPVFLDLRSRPVLVVGGGKVAFAKIPALVEAGARVTLVAPRIDRPAPGVELLVREFEPRDLDGKWYAVAAAPPEVNAQVARAARERHVFVNEQVLPDDLSQWTGIGEQARAGWKAAGIPIGERRPLLLEALNRLYARRA